MDSIPLEQARLRDIAANSLSTVDQYLANPSDRAARIKALCDAKTLVTELQDGDDAFFERFAQLSAAYTLRFIMAIGALEKIPREGGITATDLAKELGAEESLIVRTMRLLVADGTFDEVEQNEYAHTARSINLLDPVYACYFQLMTPENQRKFSIGMSGKPVAPTLGIYPFDTELVPFSSSIARQQQQHEDARVLIVDVGAAFGGAMKEIRQVFPDLKGKIVIQDRPDVIQDIPSGHLPKELDIHPMIHDFWTAQPVKGACVYYLRRIMHDWANEVCAQILRPIVSTMSHDSKLLLAEVCIPEFPVSNHQYHRSRPYLALTEEERYAYWIDHTMMTFGGKERSESDWRALLAGVGIEVVRVWRGESLGSWQAVVEGRKKK